MRPFPLRVCLTNATTNGEIGMTKNREPVGRLVIRRGKQLSEADDKSRTPVSPARRARMQLQPLARQIAEKAEIASHLRRAVGSENRELMREATKAIRSMASELDPTLSVSEVTDIVVILLSSATKNSN